MDILFLVVTLLFVISTFNRLIFSAEIIHGSKYKISLLFPTIKEIKLNLAQKIVLGFKTLSLLLYLPVVIYEDFINFYHFLILTIFLLDSILFIYQFRRNKKSFIFLTNREYFIGIATVVVICILYINALVDYYFWLLIIERLSLAIYFFFSLALSFPFEINEDIQFDKLKKSRINYKNLFAITIYGEKSKEVGSLLQKILIRNSTNVVIRKSFDNVFQIIKSFRKVDVDNSKIGIFDLQTTEDDFIKSVEIIKPQICVISDFPDKTNSDNLRYVISESVKYLNKEGVLIINVDFEKSRMKIKQFIKTISKLNKRIVVFTSKHDLKDFEFNKNVSFYYCSKLIADESSKYFIVKIDGKSYFFNSPLIDEKYKSVLVPSILTVKYMNYSMKEVVRIFLKLT